MSTKYFTGTPLDIGTGTQLLIDDTVIEDRWRLKRVMHHPRRFPHNPVILADKPWESDAVHGAKVIWDEELRRYRMWYLCFNNSNYCHGSGPVDCVAYAESEDGYNWTKPLFDHCPFGEHKKTNIVYYGTHDQGTYYNHKKWPEGTPFTRVQIADFSQVWKDNDDPNPARRYKAISTEGRPRDDLGEIHTGVQLIASPDGIHWKIDGDRPILDYPSDCLNHVVYDEAQRLWLLYGRPTVWHSGRHHAMRNIRRRVAVMTSPDFVHWSLPRVCCYPDEYDTTDYDHVRVFKYGNVLMMLYAAMDGDTTGRWELRLATSTDGFNWERYHTRETYFARGPEGAWDHGGVLPTCPPLRHGENLLLYYSGMNIGQEEQGGFTGGVGIATIKADRFVEQRAGEETAYLLTKDFVLRGKSLLINVECNKSTNLKVAPRIRVEVLRRPPLGQYWEFKQAFDGFSFEECDPLAIDHTAARVTWKGHGDLSSLVGKTVQLRFELQNAGLFSFRTAGD